MFNELEAIRQLQMRGYVIHHRTDAGVLSFSRCGPQPDSRTFEEEALDELRKQLTTKHIKFKTIEQEWLGHKSAFRRDDGPIKQGRLYLL